MYNHWYDGEHMEIGGKRYTLNYLVMCVSNVEGLHHAMAEFQITHNLTEKGLADIVARYQQGERWNKVADGDAWTGWGEK